MKRIVATIESLQSHLKTVPIVVFGAGVMGVSVVAELLKKNDLQDNVICYVDNNETSHGKVLDIGEKRVQIRSPHDIPNFSSNSVIILASSHLEILNQLDLMPNTVDMEVLVLPMAYVELAEHKSDTKKIVFGDRPIIPKVINYIWFGPKEMGDNLKKCVDSWHKYCPDYQIKKWDETNYDVEKNVFAKQAYSHGNYAFVSDFARWDILYHEGGIYLDTDVEVIKSFDDLLYQEAFCSVEKWQVVNSGGGMGAVKGQLMVGEFLEEWKKREYIMRDGSIDSKSSGVTDTNFAIKKGFVIGGGNQCIDGMNILASDFFHPFDFMTGRVSITENTHSIHHFNRGWI